MPTPLSAKFFNQVLQPTRQLLGDLAAHPLALEPDSNQLLHQFEGLVLHANHFCEKNGLQLQFSSAFRDMANSIKHIRHKPEEQVDIELAVMFESSEQGFRFIRNSIQATYVVSSREFEAVRELCVAVEQYLPIVGIKSARLNIPESSYPFYEWAVAYNRDDLAALTRSTTLITVKKEMSDYVRVDPETVRFVVLEKEAIGQDPTPHFPKI